MSRKLDAIELGRALIRCESVTPNDGGALGVLKGALEEIGFTCQLKTFSEDGTPDVTNLYARIGTGAPHFCFAGHTDTVPVGDPDSWSADPFGAEIKDGMLYGRGAADMKTAVACFAAAAGQFLGQQGDGFDGSISFLITGDEEGPAVNGTKKLLQWVAAEGVAFDACLVGEPTNPEALGDMIKIGRRGSLNGWLTVNGTAGHTAYPHLADNPIERLMKMLDAITREPWDEGSEHFPPSHAVITTVDVGNPVPNVIPAKAEARINIRFNDRHSGAGLDKLLRRRFDGVGGDYELNVRVSGEPFLVPPGPLSGIMVAAVEKATGRKPELSTTGGTSDARFIKDHCPVAEFGMTNETAHKADENALITDIHLLADIYQAVLDGFFTNWR